MRWYILLGITISLCLVIQLVGSTGSGDVVLIDPPKCVSIYDCVKEGFGYGTSSSSSSHSRHSRSHGKSYSSSRSERGYVERKNCNEYCVKREKGTCEGGKRFKSQSSSSKKKHGWRWQPYRKSSRSKRTARSKSSKTGSNKFHNSKGVKCTPAKCTEWKTIPYCEDDVIEIDPPPCIEISPDNGKEEEDCTKYIDIAEKSSSKSSSSSSNKYWRKSSSKSSSSSSNKYWRKKRHSSSSHSKSSSHSSSSHVNNRYRECIERKKRRGSKSSSSSSSKSNRVRVYYEDNDTKKRKPYGLFCIKRAPSHYHGKDRHGGGRKWYWWRKFKGSSISKSRRKRTWGYRERSWWPTYKYKWNTRNLYSKRKSHSKSSQNRSKSSKKYKKKTGSSSRSGAQGKVFRKKILGGKCLEYVRLPICSTGTTTPKPHCPPTKVWRSQNEKFYTLGEFDGGEIFNTYRFPVMSEKILQDYSRYSFKYFKWHKPEVWSIFSYFWREYVLKNRHTNFLKDCRNKYPRKCKNGEIQTYYNTQYHTNRFCRVCNGENSEQDCIENGIWTECANGQDGCVLEFIHREDCTVKYYRRCGSFCECGFEDYVEFDDRFYKNCMRSTCEETYDSCPDDRCISIMFGDTRAPNPVYVDVNGEKVKCRCDGWCWEPNYGNSNDPVYDLACCPGNCENSCFSQYEPPPNSRGRNRLQPICNNETYFCDNGLGPCPTTTLTTTTTMMMMGGQGGD